MKENHGQARKVNRINKTKSFPHSSLNYIPFSSTSLRKTRTLLFELLDNGFHRRNLFGLLGRLGGRSFGIEVRRKTTRYRIVSLSSRDNKLGGILLAVGNREQGSRTKITFVQFETSGITKTTFVTSITETRHISRHRTRHIRKIRDERVHATWRRHSKTLAKIKIRSRRKIIERSGPIANEIPARVSLNFGGRMGGNQRKMAWRM